jgi:2-polyprenyl-3-methyl-5-hydroxy-6-metoxy-1,4-benzoquinol methylase/uncharacterized protein YbaR (Trm112 family)
MNTKLNTSNYSTDSSKDMAKAENISCKLCHSKNTLSTYRVDGSKIYQCNSCKVSFSNYDIEKSQDIYKEDYYSGVDNGYGDYASELTTHVATFSQRLKYAEKYLPNKGVLLDYGCAIGHLCKVSKERGWTTFGSDFSNYGAEETQKNFQVETFVSDVTYPPIKKNSVDLLCMYDLIEHIPSPVQALTNVKEIINDGGYIHIVTPNYGSISRKLLGEKWFHFKPREHLFYFDKMTMRKVLEKSGFEIVSLTTSISYMTLSAIVLRFEKYFGKGLIGLVQKALKTFSLDNAVIPLSVGNLEAFAKPIKSSTAPKNNVKAQELREILTCPSCEDQGLDESLSCSSCNSKYSIVNDVPVMKPNQSFEDDSFKEAS